MKKQRVIIDITNVSLALWTHIEATSFLSLPNLHMEIAAIRMIKDIIS